ncbi:MAG: BMP family ABC transporter substrate-binding protein [Lachnospiraceae bacterium]|nr:BMP family ABC transporter substrate-binding protein [Lachnospiraceae bacterium]
MKKKILSLLLAAVMAVSLAACGGSSAATQAKEEPAAAEAADSTAAEKKDVKDLVIAEVHYSVVEDGGWAQAMHEGLLRACDELGVDTEKNLLTVENIAEEDTALVESTVDTLVDSGADIIFGCSAGYATIFAEIQPKYPDVIFAQQGNDVYDNIVEMQIRGYEGEFLAGYLCALMNEESDQLGFEASMDEASVRTALNAYALGAKYANPNATVQVIWADSWYDLDIEAANAEALINNGIKYMGMEASSPAVPQKCEEKGAYCIGYNIDMEANAPGAVLTSFCWNWTPIMKDIIQKTADGTIKISDNYYEGGECSKLAPFNDALVPAEIQDKVNELKSKLESGEVVVYAGELKDDKGNVLVAEGETMDDEVILAQEFFVDNVIGGKN